MNCITVVQHVAAANAVASTTPLNRIINGRDSIVLFRTYDKVVGAMSVLDGIKEKHDSSITTYVNTRVDSPPAS